MKITPDVGRSSPAMSLRRVVFPDPEGPRKTRNSASRLWSETSSTAAWPSRAKRLLRCRVSTTAIRAAPAGSRPLRDDPLDLLVGGADGVVDGELVARHLGEHRRDHEGVEDLVDGGGRVARVADVGRPLQDVPEDLVL